MAGNLAFFSYSRVDSKFALKLAKDLRNAGIDLWIDQLDIKPGSHWDSSIETGLNAANSMLIILSPDSIASNNVMDEVSFGLESGKRIIPILLRECNTPFRLRRLQRIDFTGDYNEGFNQLLDTLGRPTENKAVKPEQTTGTIPSDVSPFTTPPAFISAPPAPPSQQYKPGPEVTPIHSGVQSVMSNAGYNHTRGAALHKQRMLSLVIAGAALIFMLLPWWTLKSEFLNVSVNGLRGVGLISVIGIVLAIIMALVGDRSKPYIGKSQVTLAMISSGLIMMGALLNALISWDKDSGTMGIGTWLTLVAGLVGLSIASGLVKMNH
jgi:hypothetical protein